MNDKLRSFRWLGTSGPNDAGHYSGALHVTVVDQARRGDPSGTRRIVLFPGDLCKDQEQLAALGADRIEELVRLGQAEFLDLFDKLGVEELLGTHNVTHDSSLADIEASRRAASDAAIAGSLAARQAQLTLEAAAAGDPDARRVVAAPAPQNAIGGVLISEIMAGHAAQPEPALESVGQPPASPIDSGAMSARVRTPSWRHPA